MQKRIVTISKYIFFLSLAIALVWWSIHKMSAQEYQEFIHSLKTAKYSLVLPVFLILTASHVSRAIRWKILMKAIGYNPKLSNTYCAVMIGYLANFVFHRLGEVLKCTILGKYEKVPPDKLIGTILIERAVDLFFFFIVVVIALLTQVKIVGNYAKEKFTTYFFTHNKDFAVIKLAAISALLVILLFTLKYMFKKYLHFTIVQKIKNIYNGVIEGLLSVKNLKNKWHFIFHSVFIWVCYLAGTYIGFLAIKETASLSILATFTVLVFATFAMILMPGGIGLYPIFFVEALQLYNIPDIFSRANGWLQWSAQFVIILFWGFICILSLPYLNKTKNEIGTSNT